MCGRFTLGKDSVQIREELQVDDWPDEAEHRPSWNIAPTQECPVLHASGGMRRMRWGLIPSWAKDEKMGARMINARSETLREKPSFRNLVGRSHCIVPADGYYEWQKDAESGKIPWYICRPSGELVLLAGLWTRWSGGGAALESFTIITTEPSPAIAHLHDRMPVLLNRDEADIWLSAEPERALALLRPTPQILEFYRVSSYVNKAANDGPECIQALPQQGELF